MPSPLGEYVGSLYRQIDWLRQMTDDKDAEIEFLRNELKKATGGAQTPTRTYYWVQTMRGEQPRCRKCDTFLTRGPRGGVVDDECPNCHMNLRDGVADVPSLESR